MTEEKETAVCRGCRRQLRGQPYYRGGSAYHPVTGKQAKVNFYGGFVCSSQCDFNASLELERSMPGHGDQQRSLSSAADQSHKRNWREA